MVEKITYKKPTSGYDGNQNQDTAPSELFRRSLATAGTITQWETFGLNHTLHHRKNELNPQFNTERASIHRMHSRDTSLRGNQSSNKDILSMPRSLKKRQITDQYKEFTGKLKSDMLDIIPHPYGKVDSSMIELGKYSSSSMGEKDTDLDDQKLYLHNKRGEGVVVYVVDTGCDLTHPVSMIRETSI